MRETARRLILALCKVDVVYLASEKNKPISDAEYCFMYALDDEQPHSQKDIGQEWLIPKTTINTIAKRWEREGLLTFVPVSGSRREMQIKLTDAGKLYVKEHLAFMYQAEEAALKKTLSQFDESFISAIEAFGRNLKEAFEVQTKKR